jgi:hypothetical protein
MVSPEKQSTSRPIFEQYRPYSPEEWDEAKKHRTQSFSEVLRLVEQNPQRSSLTPEAQKFLEEKLGKLNEIIQFSAQKIAQEEEETEDPIQVVLIEPIFYTHEVPSRGTLQAWCDSNNAYHEHDESTIVAADILLSALTPELRISLGDDFQSMDEKNQATFKLGLTEQSRPEGMLPFDDRSGGRELLHFPTIVNGLTLTLYLQQEDASATISGFYINHPYIRSTDKSI